MSIKDQTPYEVALLERVGQNTETLKRFAAAMDSREDRLRAVEIRSEMHASRESLDGLKEAHRAAEDKLRKEFARALKQVETDSKERVDAAVGDLKATVQGLTAQVQALQAELATVREKAAEQKGRLHWIYAGFTLALSAAAALVTAWFKSSK